MFIRQLTAPDITDSHFEKHTANPIRSSHYCLPGRTSRQILQSSGKGKVNAVNTPPAQRRNGVNQQ